LQPHDHVWLTERPKCTHEAVLVYATPMQPPDQVKTGTALPDRNPTRADIPSLHSAPSKKCAAAFDSSIVRAVLDRHGELARITVAKAGYCRLHGVGRVAARDGRDERAGAEHVAEGEQVILRHRCPNICARIQSVYDNVASFCECLVGGMLQ